jgi:triosephosphate isomerase
MREKMIVANWKMYKTVKEAVDFVQGLLDSKPSKKAYIAVPFTAIQVTATLVKDSHIFIGAQNMNDADDGAFTGEIAGLMLKDAGASFVILGHSERRRYFHESNEFINRKVLKAFEDDLLPILCVGESYEEKESGKTEEVLQEQLQECLKGIEVKENFKMAIAYEPIWAIGSGKTATPELANSVQGFIRKIVGEVLSPEAADKVSLLYGGSVTVDNVAKITEQPEVDGVLVGGASLSLESFIKILQNSAS